MDPVQSRQIIVAGAGIAGLTAALAFAQRGFFVQIFERREALTEAGAGIQLSPNATRLLDGLGVLRAMRETAVQPPAVLLRDAGTMRKLARVPLGAEAEARWRAPYLVVHRADLQAALLAAISKEQEINLVADAFVRDVAIHRQGVTVSVDIGRTIRDVRGLLLVGADGVWSTLRRLSKTGAASRFSGMLAWRRSINADSEHVEALVPQHVVGAFLHPGFHLVAYPIRGGSAINLVAFTAGPDIPPAWSGRADPEPLRRALRATAPVLASLGDGDWTPFPVHLVDAKHPWVARSGLALIGDAAHAMTPFAAQGAAMAIEDAVSLAAAVAARPEAVDEVLPGWEAERRRRVERVRQRGAFNRHVWHASGPIAWGRNLTLRMRGAAALASDLDWLYGYDLPAPAPRAGGG